MPAPDDRGGRPAHIDHVEKVLQRKPTTIQDYRIILRKHLVPFFGEKTIERITVADCDAFMHAQLDAGVSPKSLHNRLNLLHGIFGFGVKRGWCVENPMARVDRPRSPPSNGRLRYLDREQLELLLAAVPTTRSACRAPAVSVRGDDRAAPGRADRAAMARHRLARPARACR